MRARTISAVRTIAHDDGPVTVWLDTYIPDMPTVGLEVEFPGKSHDNPVYVPVSVAREVAQAILDALPE